MQPSPAQQQPKIDDIVFPSQPSISSLLTSLKRSNLSIHNRLQSIIADAKFVQLAAQSLKQPPQPQSQTQNSQNERKTRPLVANERCGSWYIHPKDKSASAYFKSTDGHERAWKFSTRRLNLHLVSLIEKNDGIIIVDSTRRGKRMPDALSTTIPIWCAVLNRFLLPSHPLSSHLFLPPHLLPTTHAQITALIPQFVASLEALNLQPLPTLTKPLRPFWVTQESTLSSTDDSSPGIIYEDYRPVVCLTASRRVTAGTEADEQGYIQGAADDTENWAHGLTPTLFWDHSDLLLSTPEADLPGLIQRLVEEHEATKTGDSSSRVQVSPYISVCALPLPAPVSEECHIALLNTSTTSDSWVKSPQVMEVGLGRHKTAARNLRTALPDICTFVAALLSKHLQASEECRVVVACESGRDISVGTALALSCYLFDEGGKFRVPDENMSFTKTQVKIKLGSIMTAFPGGNPSRQTLQSVNSFLMDWRRG